MYFVCIACEYGEGVRGCEGYDNAGVGMAVVVVSAGYECVGCTRDAGVFVMQVFSVSLREHARVSSRG